MKILLNGFHWGGNTPPFVKKFKELGHTVKLICPYELTKKDLYNNKALSDYLQDDDLIFANYSFFEINILKILSFILRVFAKLKLPNKFIFDFIIFLKSKVTKQIVNQFAPDIIYNHSLSEHTYVMIKTNFKPQVSFPFGSEIQGKYAWKNFEMHQKIISESEKILAALPGFVDFFIKQLNVPANKIPKPIPIGLPDLFKLIKNKVDKEEVLKRFKIPLNDITIIDVRGLRKEDGGVNELIHAIKDISEHNIHLILVKGYLGNPNIVKKTKKEIKKLRLDKKVTIIEEVLDYDDLIDLIKSSNIGVSLLPHDGLGKSIMEYISQGCQLLLTDLIDYRIAFKENAEYVNPRCKIEIKTSIIKIIEMDYDLRKKRLYQNLKWLEENQDFEKNCKRLISLFEEVVIDRINK